MRNVLRVSAVMILLACGGRQRGGATAEPLRIIANGPSGQPVASAQIYMNGSIVGMGVADVTRERVMAISVNAGAEFLPVVVTADARTQSPLVLNLQADECYAFTTLDNDQVVNRWLNLSIGEASKASWWNAVVTGMSTQSFEVEMMDRESGFLRTAWKQRSFPGVDFRRRFVGNTVTTNPLVWRMRYEVQIRRQGDRDWIDYERGVRDELDVIAEIRGRAQER